MDPLHSEFMTVFGQGERPDEGTLLLWDGFDYARAHVEAADDDSFEYFGNDTTHDSNPVRMQ